MQLKRPAGMTAQRALETGNAEFVADMRRAARAALEYWRECIEQAGSVN